VETWRVHNGFCGSEKELFLSVCQDKDIGRLLEERTQSALIASKSSSDWDGSWYLCWYSNAGRCSESRL